MPEPISRRRARVAEWLAAIALAVALLGNATVYVVNRDANNNASQNHQVLCTFKSDLQKRYAQGVQFLQDHPHGITDIPASILRNSLKGQRATLQSLSDLRC